MLVTENLLSPLLFQVLLARVGRASADSGPGALGTPLQEESSRAGRTAKLRAPLRFGHDGRRGMQCIETLYGGKISVSERRSVKTLGKNKTVSLRASRPAFNSTGLRGCGPSAINTTRKAKRLAYPTVKRLLFQMF